MYNKRNTYSFRNHVITAYKRIFTIFSYMDGRPNILAGDDASSLEESMETPLSRRKMPNDDPSCTSAM